MKKVTTDDFRKEMWMHAWILVVVGVISIVLYLSTLGYLLNL